MARLKDKTSQINSISQFWTIVKVLRVLFFFYAFLCFFFWFLNCFDVEWIYSFDWLFIIPYKFVSNFYRPQGVSADFTLIIIGVIFLVFGFFSDTLSNMLVSVLDKLEEEQVNYLRQRREAKAKKYSKKISQNSNIYNNDSVYPPRSSVEIPTTPPESSKLVFIITSHVNKIKKSQNDLELTFQEVDVWKQKINKKLIDNVSYSKPMQKGYYRKNLFLVYKDFNYVDDFIYYIRPTLDSISLEFRKFGVSVSYSYVLSALSQLQYLEKELDCMDTVLSLGFSNQIIVTSRFKVTYNTKVNPQYSIRLKGEYNLSKNLSISNKQQLYILTDNREKGTKQ